MTQHRSGPFEPNGHGRRPGPTPIERVVEALTTAGCGPKRCGQGWAARCPAHEDHTPSLSVNEGADGRALLNCHANCELDAILTAAELTAADLFPTPAHNTNGTRQIVATYRYVDENNRLLYEAVRYTPKDFRQRQPDGKGGWIWNMQGARRVPYRLPQLLTGIADGDEVFIVEGEKDVHSLEAVGQVATTNPMGAGKWCAEYAPFFAGADVIVVADRDKAGYEHARTIAASLRPVAATVRLVEPAEGKDVADHLAAGRKVEELVLVDPDQPGTTSAATDDETRFRRWTMPELLDADRTFAWLAKRLLVRPTYGQIGGARKTLKTYVELFINIGVASGQPIFGEFHIPEPGPVVLYAGEGGRIPITNRIERVAQAMGVNPRTIPLHTHYDTAPFASEIFQATLRNDLDELNPHLISIDPYYAFHGATTNASNLFEEGALLTSLSTPCIEAGATLLIANHFRKTPGGEGLDKITQSGGQEWSDTWILLSHRQDPNIELGEFHLLLEIGSRQWGGTTWDLDLNIGRFDPDYGEYDGDITWNIQPHTDPNGTSHGDHTRDLILDILADTTWTLTKTEIRDKVAGKRDAFQEAWSALRTDEKIVAERLPHPEGTRTVARDLWAPAGTPRPQPTNTQTTSPTNPYPDMGTNTDRFPL